MRQNFLSQALKKGTQKVIYYYCTTLFTVPLMPPKLWWTTFPYIFVDLQDHLHTCMHGGLVDLVHWDEKATLIWKTMAPALRGCHQIGTIPGSRPAACSLEQWANCSEPWQIIWWSLATNSVSFHRLIMAVRFIILCKDRCYIMNISWLNMVETKNMQPKDLHWCLRKFQVVESFHAGFGHFVEIERCPAINPEKGKKIM